MCPIDVDLGNDDNHAYENCEDLETKSIDRGWKKKRKMPTMQAIRISNIFTGLPRRGSPIARRTMTSKAVINTPCQSSSFGKSKQSAIADPRSSARSVAIMATSART
jgi:hypothetical protein